MGTAFNNEFDEDGNGGDGGNHGVGDIGVDVDHAGAGGHSAADAGSGERSAEDDGAVDEPAVLFSPKRYAHERVDDPVCAMGLRRNAAELEVSRIAAPNPEDDVEDHLARIHPKLGVPNSVGLAYCDIGTALRLLPNLARLLAERPFLPFQHLKVLARTIPPVNPEVLPVVERDLLRFLSPNREGQALPGPRSLFNHLRRSIEHLDPDMRPKDPEEEPPPKPKVERMDIDTRSDECAKITAILRADEGREFEAIIRAIVNAHDCTMQEALMHAVRNTADVSVNINIYRDVAGGPVWMSGVGWLDEVASREWVSRVTGVRIATNGLVGGYTPTDAMMAFLEGRDGTCRFPNCERPAHGCDKDHVMPYDHGNPAAGGPSDTGNLHCLCRRHHNLKTSGLWNVEAHPDGTEVWSSADGEEEYVTMPEGPLRGFGRRTFDQRATRLAATLKEHNDARRAHLAEQRATTEAAKNAGRAEFWSKLMKGEGEPAPGNEGETDDGAAAPRNEGGADEPPF